MVPQPENYICTDDGMHEWPQITALTSVGVTNEVRAVMWLVRHFCREMSRIRGSFLQNTGAKQWTNHCTFVIGVPVPEKYRETIWSPCGLKRFLTAQFFNDREVHDYELIVSVHESVQMIVTNFACRKTVCIGARKLILFRGVLCGLIMHSDMGLF
jgi:hypothetical protein